jgi:hypothetical protein
MTKDETIEPSLAESRSREIWHEPTAAIIMDAVIANCDFATISAIKDDANKKRLRSRATGGVTSPDYVMVPRSKLQYVRDLLTEKVYGSHARSPGHNARLEVDEMLSAAPKFRAIMMTDSKQDSAAPPSPRSGDPYRAQGTDNAFVTPSKHGFSAALRAQVIEECAKVADSMAKSLRVYRDHFYVAEHVEDLAKSIRSLSAVPAIALHPTTSPSAISEAPTSAAAVTPNPPEVS